MLKNLPLSLLKASQKIVETQDVLESCPSCGMVQGSCLHTEGEILEDELSAMAIPGEEEPKEELSGETEEVVINPQYLTFTSRR